MHSGKLEDIERLGELRGKVNVDGNMFNEAKSGRVTRSADAEKFDGRERVGLLDYGQSDGAGSATNRNEDLDVQGEAIRVSPMRFTFFQLLSSPLFP